MRLLTIVLSVLSGILLWTNVALAESRYVATDGSDSDNDCTTESAPCQTITHGIAQMVAGDTLFIDDGTYAEPIARMPSGTPAAYTTIRAKHDWGVTIDGSGFPDDFIAGIDVVSASYVHIRGFRVRMNQSFVNNNSAIAVLYSDHIKIVRCGASYAPTDNNAVTIGVGPDSSNVLLEETYAFGGGRYQILVFESENVLVRRSVVRNDHWTGSLQCAGFVNYDSRNTVWQNNIALDSDDQYCSGKLYGGFWHENKEGVTPDTSQTLAGNIVLNLKTYFGGNFDPKATGTHTIRDMVIWGSTHGATFQQGPGDVATVDATRMTIGDISGTYSGPNDQAAAGTGFSVYEPITNSLTHSLLYGCNSLGVADHTVSDYNAFFGNGANYGGATQPAVGPNDLSAENGNEIDPSSSLRYLIRIEPNSPLKTAGNDGGQIGAEIVYRLGREGTLYGEPGWDELTTEPLWPFPNEDQIRADMASYSGPGAPGERGFTTGTSLDGTPQTLTKYIWEHLGNEIPSDIYGLRITADSLPLGYPGISYSKTFEATGGVPPYTWSVTGDLPAGLTYDAETALISGTPEVIETKTLTITVTDATNDTSSKQLQLEVRAEPEVPGNDDGANRSDGCACTSASAGNPQWMSAYLALFALALLRARRRRLRWGEG